MIQKKTLSVLSFVLIGCGACSDNSVEAINVAKGERVFEQVCSACHAFGSSSVGPDLNGVIGRNVGSLKGFAYSDAMKTDKNSVWSDERIKSFIMGPLKMYPEGRMVISPMKAEDADAVVAYIKDRQ